MTGGRAVKGERLEPGIPDRLMKTARTAIRRSNRKYRLEDAITTAYFHYAKTHTVPSEWKVRQLLKNEEAKEDAYRNRVILVGLDSWDSLPEVFAAIQSEQISTVDSFHRLLSYFRVLSVVMPKTKQGMSYMRHLMDYVLADNLEPYAIQNLRNKALKGVAREVWQTWLSQNTA